MREKYETLNLVDLKEIAKARGLKSVSAMKKADLIDRLCNLDAKESSSREKTSHPAGRTPKNRKLNDTIPANVPSTNPAASKALPSYSTRTSKATTASDSPSQSNHSKTGSRRIIMVSNQSSRRDTNHSASRYPISNQQNYNPSSASANRFRNNDNYKNIDSFKNNDTTFDISRQDTITNENNSLDSFKQDNERIDNSKVDFSRNDYDRTNISKNDYLKSDIYKSDTVKNDGEKTSIPSENLTDENSVQVSGILQIMPDGYGFIRDANYESGANDIYVAPVIIKKFSLRKGDILAGRAAIKTQNEKFAPLLRLDFINGYTPDVAVKRFEFRKMTPIFPNERLTLERSGGSVAMRIMDLIAPIGKGQRGMIVSPPKAGKTTLLKEVAKSIKTSYPEIHLIILLIDERPEEVTDIKESLLGPNVEVIHSTFDEGADHHVHVAEMTLEHAQRLVEHQKDVFILIDSITRLTRAYNQTISPSGRTLSGGLDPAALHMPKRFFGAARNMREGGSLTILATALIETGSKMDDVVYEEFKGTGNMEVILDRKLQEKRIFPAINISKSSTRREDLLLTSSELDAVNYMRKGFNSLKADEAVDQILSMFSQTRSNRDFIHLMEKKMLF
ncbi:transcription termination factor Rho [Butyrivibrio sp. NC3005]|uniref:transcription termination factor Rho n=1 Tax=Butyrivibrio sp. NC3005 TaxID=1280685 RepID=UPI00040BC8B6|nr:transcription termination factor Rho [Butyrivibrio sp. NC3005]